MYICSVQDTIDVYVRTYSTYVHIPMILYVHTYLYVHMYVSMYVRSMYIRMYVLASVFVGLLLQ